MSDTGTCSNREPGSISNFRKEQIRICNAIYKIIDDDSNYDIFQLFHKYNGKVTFILTMLT